MTFEDAVTARIAVDGALASMLADDGGWSSRLRQVPGITLQIVVDPRPQHLKGYQRVRQTSVQADVYTTTRPAAARTRDALIALMSPAELVGGIQFQRGMIVAVRATTESEQSGERQRFRGDLARESIDFIFTHNAN